MVTLDESGVKGPYLERATTNYNTCARLLYADLEHDSAKLHKESAELVLEYANIMDTLALPDEAATGVTASIRHRDEKRIAAVKPKLRSRKQEIELRLAAIEEDIGTAANEAANLKREAASLTSRRIHAYLHGACLALRSAQSGSRYEIYDDFDDAQEYNERHAHNDDTRRKILAVALKGVESHEV